MKPYPRYRDAGVEWIGEVPEGWKVLPLKWLVTASSGTGIKSEKGDIPLYGANGAIGFSETVSEPSGALLIGRVGSAGSVTLVKEPCAVSDNALVIRNKGAASRGFLHYLMLSLNFASDISKNAQPLITGTAVTNKIIAFPVRVEEQHTIATYLDRKTAQIDELIAKKHRLIALLREERAAVINQAVTKGLDPFVKMKDSGVDWLGKIPEHWALKPLKYVVTLQRGHDLPAEKRNEGNIPVITSAGATGMHNQAMAKAPGIVTGRYGTIGTFYLIDIDYWPLNTTLYSINLYGNLAKYVWYMLQILSPIFLLNSSKSAVPGVDRNDLHPTITAIPPSREEQTAIASFLEHKTTQIDETITKTEKQIQLLQDYRTALISEVVTGKIDVREEVTA